VDIVRFLGILRAYFNLKNYKANHAMSENEQYYGSIEIVCVRA
jgi:hypothetical protein